MAPTISLSKQLFGSSRSTILLNSTCSKLFRPVANMPGISPTNGDKTLLDSNLSLPVKAQQRRGILTAETMNPKIKKVEYAVRGPIVVRAGEIERELKSGSSKPFEQVTRANIGDCHAVGNQPITYIRQVLACCLYPDLMSSGNFPSDVVEKAKHLLSGCAGASMGSYTDSAGIELVRKDVAKYIEARDGGIPADPSNIFLTTGASDAIRTVMKMLLHPEGQTPVGVMIPIPQYPLYSATISEYGAHQISYYLDEASGWSLGVPELRRAIGEARDKCNPGAICVINPGNPTGQVLTKQNIEDVIRFAKEEGLFILADEVYQANVYAEGSEFHSFKKVMCEMGGDFAEIPLASFHSMSKGWQGECGLRGGYMEVVNLDPFVKAQMVKLISTKLCSSTVGQCAMSLVTNEPKIGDTSYDLFVKEKTHVLNTLKEKAKLVADTFNSIPGISCNPVMGAMYTFPSIHLTQKAIDAAKEDGKTPDAFYCFSLLEQTGLCVVPGSGFGQKPGTFHFRMTILPPFDTIKKNMELFKDFHLKFMEKYS